MGESVTSLARRFIVDEQRTREGIVHPVLLWTTETQSPDREMMFGTAIVGTGQRPRANDPLVLTVHKPEGAKSAFAMGVTIGRAKNNDVTLDDDSVSRFHAYIRPDVDAKQWAIVDADSSNGTFVNMVRLKAGQARTLENGAAVRFGDVQTTFLTPEGLLAHLERMVNSP